MISHPELMFLQATERQRALIAEADPFRHIRAARLARRARRERAAAQRRQAGRDGPRPAVAGRSAGTLGTCGPSVAAPAR